VLEIVEAVPAYWRAMARDRKRSRARLGMPFTVAGKPVSDPPRARRRVSHVYRRYFQTFGVKMVRGRAINEGCCRQPSGGCG